MNRQPLPEEQRPESFGYNSPYNLAHLVTPHGMVGFCSSIPVELARSMTLAAIRQGRVAMGLPAEWESDE